MSQNRRTTVRIEVSEELAAAIRTMAAQTSRPFSEVAEGMLIKAMYEHSPDSQRRSIPLHFVVRQVSAVLCKIMEGGGEGRLVPGKEGLALYLRKDGQLVQDSLEAEGVRLYPLARNEQDDILERLERLTLARVKRQGGEARGTMLLRHNRRLCFFEIGYVPDETAEGGESLDIRLIDRHSPGATLTLSGYVEETPPTDASS
jgi:hypothetical protein